MDRLLRPEKLELDPSSPTATLEWEYWHRTFINFIACTNSTEEQKLRLLINHLSPTVYQHVSKCGTYTDAIAILESIYIKPINVVFARHELQTRKQRPDENINQYVQSLKALGKTCQF